MKTKLLALAGACALLLSGCGSVMILGGRSYERLVLGRWVNEGTQVEWAGEKGGVVTALTFLEGDRVQVETAEGRSYEYGYTMSEDILTIQQKNIAYGVPYETDGGTLTLGADGDNGVYTFDATEATPEVDP